MDGDGETYIHIITYKNKKVMNTNVAFMHRYESKERLGGCESEFHIWINDVLILAAAK